MPRRRQILVIGHNDGGCKNIHKSAAYEAGVAVAVSGSVLISGGLGGVMEASCRGAQESGGLAVGIIPQNDASAANGFCDIVIPTGVGLMRDFVNAQAADGIVIIGGGSGTLSEMCAAYMYKKPMVAVRGTGGAADEYASRYLDYRGSVMIKTADTAKEAVGMLLEMIHSSEPSSGSGA